MRSQVIGRLVLVLCGGMAGALTVTYTVGQPPPPRQLPKNLPAVDVGAPPVVVPPANGGVRQVSNRDGQQMPPLVAPPNAPRRAVAFDRFRNQNLLPDQTRQMVICTQMGMEWLHRYNQATGQFLHGYIPAVNVPLDGDNSLHQAMAAFVLARAAKFTGDARYAVRANQAILTLLTFTTLDQGVRRPALQSMICNRLGTAAFAVLAINELPDASPDLQAKSEELCAFIRQQQLPNGSLNYLDNPNDNPLEVDPDGINHYPAPALLAIVMSHRNKPAPWKMDLFNNAVGFYRKHFKDHPKLSFVPWMTAALVECHTITKEQRLADFAFEMNDWLCKFQYDHLPDPRQALWRGGFKTTADGKSMPGIESALFAQSLADCCRMLRRMEPPDVARYDNYRTHLMRAMQFLMTLQFNESNTLHFAANYRMMLVGGFHPTHIDGNLRIDQGAMGVSAFIQFLLSGVDRDK